MNNIVKVDETTLNRVMSKHFNDGFIIITADRSEITNKREKEQRFKQLKNDIANAGYSYIPVYGGYKETDPETGKLYDAPSFEHGLIVPNQKPFTNEARETDELVDLGKNLAKKYDQESFLYKPQGQNNKAFWIDQNGNVTNEFNNVTINNAAQMFFTKLFQGKKSGKSDRRFTFLPELFLNKAPYNASEAYKRFGEQFIR